MVQAHAPDADKYYVPHGSPWPIYGAVSMFVLMVGAACTLNAWLPAWSLLPGFLLLISMFVFWFGTVIGENEHGIYNMAVDRSFRLGMMWFIMSEVMFFAAFFGALFYARELAVPWLSGHGVKVFNNILLWKDYGGSWPTNGPAALGPRANGTFETIPALGLPCGQHRHSALEQRDGDDRAPRIDRGPSHAPEDLPGDDVPPRLHFRVPAGHGIS